MGVSSTPGKTRAIDYFLVNNEFRLVDLPGYGYARVSRQMQAHWKYLVEAYLREQKNLAAVVFILDIRRTISDMDQMLLNWLDTYDIACIPVFTKADKFPFSRRDRQAKAIRADLAEGVEPVVFSAKTGLGKAGLWKRIQAAMWQFKKRISDE